MKLLLTEAIRGQLMLKMADPGWGNHIYGRGADFTKMKWAGCGPTAFAMIMSYLLRTAPGGSKIGPVPAAASASFDDSELNRYPNTKALMLDIIAWAGATPAIRPGPKGGKLSGTSGNALVRAAAHKFKGFSAELVSDTERALDLLKRGELLMAGGRQRGWRTREALLKDPHKPDAHEYKAHYVVLWGADHLRYNNIQILWVLDPGSLNDTKAIHYTTQVEHKGKSFIYIHRSTALPRISSTLCWSSKRCWPDIRSKGGQRGVNHIRVSADTCWTNASPTLAFHPTATIFHPDQRRSASVMRLSGQATAAAVFEALSAAALRIGTPSAGKSATRHHVPQKHYHREHKQHVDEPA
jgi:hypothetical protein